MDLEEARKLALALPEAVESAHMGHPVFRVRKKIFASFPDGERIVVKLTAEQQAIMTEAEPKIFAAGQGRLGQAGLDLCQSRGSG